MNITGFIILILPVILHIKGSRTILVFFVMNSIINILMQRNKVYIKTLGAIIEDESGYINQGLSYEEALERIIADAESIDMESWVPKGINIVISIATIISLGGILVGIGVLQSIP